MKLSDLEKHHLLKNIKRIADALERIDDNTRKDIPDEYNDALWYVVDNVTQEDFKKWCKENNRENTLSWGKNDI